MSYPPHLVTPVKVLPGTFTIRATTTELQINLGPNWNQDSLKLFMTASEPLKGAYTSPPVVAVTTCGDPSLFLAWSVIQDHLSNRLGFFINYFIYTNTTTGTTYQFTRGTTSSAVEGRLSLPADSFLDPLSLQLPQLTVTSLTVTEPVAMNHTYVDTISRSEIASRLILILPQLPIGQLSLPATLSDEIYKIVYEIGQRARSVSQLEISVPFSAHLQPSDWAEARRGLEEGMATFPSHRLTSLSVPIDLATPVFFFHISSLASLSVLIISEEHSPTGHPAATVRARLDAQWGPQGDIPTHNPLGKSNLERIVLRTDARVGHHMSDAAVQGLSAYFPRAQVHLE